MWPDAAGAEGAGALGRAGWTAALAQLEDVVFEAQRAASDPQLPAPAIAAWEPPQGLGPMPADLREHARRVNEAQLAALSALGQARATVARHLGAVESASADLARTGSLDVTG
ncbi:hypothetical protein E2F48_11210 [Arthrobacter crusticola]|uniref:Flagellar protein FlgN n=1 Tax=Arthrobacter crusticola TaxID=2547960 RepID=A0A4R5TXC1_9MICC|nr:hypothetical protein [Arthrobacter crusticola]TDK25790.1 hypothetical protein E2F48_11210 [Arthrobacter crusticola]